MLVSYLLLTLDRAETTIQAYEHNLKAAQIGLDPHIEVELLVCDNGSKDPQVIEYFKDKASYHRINSINEGCAKAYNQLYLRAGGEIITFSGSDNFQPNGWLQMALSEMAKMDKPGIVGISDGAPETRGPGWITGAYVVAKSCIEACGFLHDDFDVYGCEDLDFNERVLRMGFECKMVPELTGSHSAHLPCDSQEYRKMKFNSYVKNLSKLHKRRAKMAERGAWKELLPEMRDPL